MARDNYQKVKLLVMYEILKQESDQDHPFTTSMLCSRLGEMDIPCDRRTLTKDVAMLNELGFEVQVRNVSHEKGYYMKDRSFSVPEIKLMMDSVQAAAFVTEDKTKELVDKIARLAGTRRAEVLKKNLVCFNTRKHTNEAVYQTIDLLENALEKHSKASFQYFDLDETGQRVLRKQGKRYVVDPMALIYNADNYYLMCWSGKYDGICNYRVDRMTEVQTETDPVNPEAIVRTADTSDYTRQVFKMYGGPAVDCALEFDNSLIGVIYDKFGEDTQMIRLSPEKCIATVKVQVSPTFWGWIFQFVGKMRILSPQGLADEYAERCANALGTRNEAEYGQEKLPTPVE